jgi:hypothetical protein
MRTEEFLNGMKVSHHFLKGLLSNKGVYNLSFEQDPDGRWYIDMPWDGSRANLEMVCGADDLLSFLDTEGRHRVDIEVVPSKELIDKPGYFVCDQLSKSLMGGSWYMVKDLEGFARKIWICPVTLAVLGRYPRYIYIKKR